MVGISCPLDEEEEAACLAAVLDEAKVWTFRFLSDLLFALTRPAKRRFVLPFLLSVNFPRSCSFEFFFDNF